MFTGLVEAAAAVRAIGRRAGGARLDVERPEAFVDAARGESISVSGVCLTIVPGAESGLLRFDVSAETLDRSTLGALRPGDAVNLERALAAGGRMGGHVVQGHVDATTPVTRLERSGDFWTLGVRLDPSFSRYVVEKDSIAFPSKRARPPRVPIQRKPSRSCAIAGSCDWGSPSPRPITSNGSWAEAGRASAARSVSAPAKALVRPRAVPLDLHVAYLSGRGAAGLPVKVRTVVEPWTLQFRDYPDYAFGGAPVKEGIVTGGAFDAFDFERPPQQEPAASVRVLPLTLDAAGGARVTIEDLPKLDTPQQLVAELEYPDANGQLLSATGRVRLATAALALGIRSEGWVASSKQLRFRVLALDLEGRPQASVPVQVSLYRQQSYSYRKRLVGGFYAYESTTETKRIDAA